MRLILSGLFDEFPSLQLILGHLGEVLPYLLPRLQHRMDEQREGERGNKARHRPSHYFARNFYITTSGHFHTRQMEAAVEQIGMERILFSVDYPYEQMDVAGRWFDDMSLGRADKYGIGRGNAPGLFKLDMPVLPHAAALGFAS